VNQAAPDPFFGVALRAGAEPCRQRAGGDLHGAAHAHPAEQPVRLRAKNPVAFRMRDDGSQAGEL